MKNKLANLTFCYVVAFVVTAFAILSENTFKDNTNNSGIIKVNFSNINQYS